DDCSYLRTAADRPPDRRAGAGVDVEPAQTARSPAEALRDRPGLDRNRAANGRAGRDPRRRRPWPDPRYVRRRTTATGPRDLDDAATAAPLADGARTPRDRLGRGACRRAPDRNRDQADGGAD